MSLGPLFQSTAFHTFHQRSFRQHRPTPPVQQPTRNDNSGFEEELYLPGRLKSSLRANTNTQQNQFAYIPNEVVVDVIFPFLFVSDIIRFSLCCKSFYSQIFHAIHPNDALWKRQLRGLPRFFESLSIRSTALEDNISFQYGKMQEYKQRLNKRLNYYDLKEVIAQKQLSVLYDMDDNVEYQATINRCESLQQQFEVRDNIRETVLDLCRDFVTAFENHPNGIQSVSVNERYSTMNQLTLSELKSSKSTTLWTRLFSPHFSTKNKRLSPNTSVNILCEKPSYELMFVGCSERSVHSAIVQTFSKDYFPSEYITTSGSKYSCQAMLKDTENVTSDEFKLTVVDMPVGVSNEEFQLYATTASCIIVVFNRRYESSFRNVTEQIIPQIMQHSNAKIILLGIDWLDFYLTNPIPCNSMRYKFGLDELTSLEPISQSRVLNLCKTNEHIIGYLEFSPREATKDMMLLMDCVLKIWIGYNEQINFFPSPLHTQPTVYRM